MYNKINDSFLIELHTFMNDNLKAEVWKTTDGHYGCRFWRDKVWLKDEVYKDRSESYAEDAADNYVMGVKTI